MILDWLVVVLLVILSLTILLARDLFWVVASFITFGLVLTLAWSSLQAPDLALAEAAIGGGLMTLFLIDSLGFSDPEQTSSAGGFPITKLQGLTALGSMIVAVPLLRAFWAGGAVSPGLGPLVEQKIELSGVEHPVSAVLLNFRFFDTWFEMTVILLAIVALQTLRGRTPRGDSLPSGQSDQVLTWFARLLSPVLILFSVYLLWRGKHAPGGAFQSGVVLGAALSVLALTGYQDFLLRSPVVSRLVVTLGVVGFSGAGLFPLVLGGELAELPSGWAGDTILIVETMAALSTGMSIPYLLVALQVPKDKVQCEERTS